MSVIQIHLQQHQQQQAQVQQQPDPTESIQRQTSTISISGGGSGQNLNMDNINNANQASTATNTASTGPMQGELPQEIRLFLKTLDDQEWQTSLFTLLQNQTSNQVEVDLFELMCNVLDPPPLLSKKLNNSFFKLDLL